MFRSRNMGLSMKNLNFGGKTKNFKCDECVPRGPESLPTKFHLLMFSIYRDIDAKTAELSFGTPCIYSISVIEQRTSDYSTPLKNSKVFQRFLVTVIFFPVVV